MANVTKTLSWQSTVGDTDHYQIGIATTSSGTPVVIFTTDNADTQATITYDAATYPTAWLFVRAIASDSSASDWSDPVAAESLVPLITPPQPIQYCYANDIRDLLIGMSFSATFTDRVLNKIALGASREVDRLTDRRFSPQTVTERYSGTGTSELTISHYPILKVNYCRIESPSGLEIIREYNQSDLELSDWETGMLVLKPVILDNLDEGWNTAASLLYGHIFAEGIRNVEVSYQYGYMTYTEGEELQYVQSETNSSTGVVSRVYRTIHHNLNTNNISVYKNGTLLTSGYSVDSAEGLVTIANGLEDDTVVMNYYSMVPHDIEVATAKLAAISVVAQHAASVTGGVSSFKNMNYQEVYGAKPYSSTLDQLSREYRGVLERYTRFDMHAA
jgi:hypothetical protein